MHHLMRFTPCACRCGRTDQACSAADGGVGERGFEDMGGEKYNLPKHHGRPHHAHDRGRTHRACGKVITVLASRQTWREWLSRRVG